MKFPPTPKKLTDRQLAKLEARLKREIIQATFTTFVATGQVDPQGKSEEELETELLTLLRAVVKGGGFRSVVDHRTSLLAQARDFAKKDDSELAILLYATWFEHWLNALFDNRAHLHGFKDKDVHIALRQIGLDAKLICFPLFLQLPRLSPSHVATVRECSNLRNAFVHYKFAARPAVDDATEEKTLGRVLEASEKTVRYLCNYERLHIFKRAKKRIETLAAR